MALQPEVRAHVMRLALNLNFSFRYPILLIILWALGASMIILAGLIHLPIRWLAVLSVAVVALHNCLDGINLPVLHSGAPIHFAGLVFVAGYPLIPWFAVMAAGFCFDQIYALRWTLKIGLALTIEKFNVMTAGIIAHAGECDDLFAEMAQLFDCAVERRTGGPVTACSDTPPNE